MASDEDTQVINTLELPKGAVGGFLNKAEKGALLAAAARLVPEAKRAELATLIVTVVSKSPPKHHAQVCLCAFSCNSLSIA